MIPRFSVFLIGLAGLLLAAVGELRAEVSVRTDRAGNYIATQIVTTNLRGDAVIWGMRGRMPSRHHVLNPKGDLHGDLWPVIVESTLAPRLPWIVWSRFNGTDFDLAWSRWTAQGWRPVDAVLAEPSPGDDLDPDIAFDGDGQAYLAWSREAEGVFEVQLSVWGKRIWMSPVRVSEPGVDSRYPVIVGFGNGSVDVEFTTPTGTVVQRVLFSTPGTITDDINPVHFSRDLEVPTYDGDSDRREDR